MKRILLAMIVAAGIAGCGTEPPVIEYRYTVQEGDTVWDVASYVATDKEDVRDIVRTIIRDNNVKDAVIQPGQELVIHVKGERNNV